MSYSKDSVKMLLQKMLDELDGLPTDSNPAKENDEA